jgi:hypothetical protein
VMREVYDLDSTALTKFPARKKNCISPDFDKLAAGRCAIAQRGGNCPRLGGDHMLGQRLLISLAG